MKAVARAKLVAGSIAAILVCAAGAEAQPQPEQQRRMPERIRVDPHITLGSSFGAGVGVDIPLVSSVEATRLDDSLVLRPGVDVLFVDVSDGETGATVSPNAVFQWNFFIQERWSVFPEVGIAVTFVDDGVSLHSNQGDVEVDPVVNVGARYHMGQNWALTARLGWPYGLQLGVLF